MRPCKNNLVVVLLTLLCPLLRSRGLCAEDARHGPATLEQALDALGATAMDERVRAVRALGRFKSEEAVDALVRACADKHFYVRRFALRSLRAIGDARALEASKACLSDKYAMVREEAASTIDALAPDSKAVWLGLFRGAPADPRVRSVALSRLVEADPKAITEEIRAAARNNNIFMRRAAAEGLARLGGDEDLELLRALARDTVTEVRTGTVDACVLLRDTKAALSIIESLCGDADQGVRWRCVEKLADVRSPDSGPLYLKILREEKVTSVRAFAAKRMRSIMNAPAMREPLREALQNEQEEQVRKALDSTLRAIEDAEQARVAGIAADGVHKAAPIIEREPAPGARVHGAPLGVIISEVCYWPKEDDNEWVELTNTSDKQVGIGGWELTDGLRLHLVFPENVPVVPPGGFVLIIFDGRGGPIQPFDQQGKTTLHTPPGLKGNSLGDKGGHLALYAGRASGSDHAIQSYVAWGWSPGMIISHAIASRRWVTGKGEPDVTPDSSLQAEQGGWIGLGKDADLTKGIQRSDWRVFSPPGAQPNRDGLP